MVGQGPDGTGGNGWLGGMGQGVEAGGRWLGGWRVGSGARCGEWLDGWRVVVNLPRNGGSGVERKAKSPTGTYITYRLSPGPMRVGLAGFNSLTYYSCCCCKHPHTVVCLLITSVWDTATQIDIWGMKHSIWIILFHKVMHRITLGFPRSPIISHSICDISCGLKDEDLAGNMLASALTQYI